MAINRVEIKDSHLFKEGISLDFCPGVNILIGGNGMGKTTILKDIYNHNRPATKTYGKRDIQNPNALVVEIRAASPVTLTGNYDFANAIFIPVAEMLQHSKGLLELNATYAMPFDQIQINILIKAGLPETRELTPNAQKVLERVSNVIDGEVLYEDGRYAVLKRSGKKVPYSREASGFQKFGLLWKLLRNGLLESGSTLFWDEPEASVNPELMSVLVDILLELQRGGVQIFIATHSGHLARYFDVNQKANDQIRFHNLHKDGETIKCNSSLTYTDLSPNVIEQADDVFFKDAVAQAMGVDRNG
jgi:predicted ATPase